MHEITIIKWNQHQRAPHVSKKDGNLHIKGKTLYKYGNFHTHVNKTW